MRFEFFERKIQGVIYDPRTQNAGDVMQKKNPESKAEDNPGVTGGLIE